MFQSERHPVRPEPFGYKLTWLAVKEADPFELLHAVNIRQDQVLSANWHGGLDKVYRCNATFITPAVGAWTLVLNPVLGEFSAENTLAFLQKLSIQFAEVQFYGNHRVVEYGAWGRFVNGEAVRLFSTGETSALDQGQLTETETRLAANRKYSFDENEVEYPLQATELFFLGAEDDVLEMAGLWSINPQTLDQQPETLALGLLIVRS